MLQEIWDSFRVSGEWPILRALYSKHGTLAVREALSSLGRSIGFEQPGNQRWSRYQLSLLGVLLSHDGPQLQTLIKRFFEFQRRLFQQEPARDTATSAEIATALGLSKEETGLLGKLVSVGTMGGGRDEQKGTWSVSAMEEAAFFDPTDNLANIVEEWVLRFYQPDGPTFQDQGRPPWGAIPLLPNPATSLAEQHPPEITTSLQRLRERYPDPKKLGFLIMRFRKAKPFTRISDVVKAAAAQHHLDVIRADDLEFHSGLWENVRTLLHGCGFGIAVYERIETNEQNANIGLEVGYLMAMNKPVLLLKDETLAQIPSDLVGKLYKTFDPHNPRSTIPAQIIKWAEDNGIIVRSPTGISH